MATRKVAHILTQISWICINYQIGKYITEVYSIVPSLREISEGRMLSAPLRRWQTRLL